MAREENRNRTATKALMNRIDWMHEIYLFARGEVACCKTSIGFVDSVWEMLGPLLAGTDRDHPR